MTPQQAENAIDAIVNEVHEYGSESLLDAETIESLMAFAQDEETLKTAMDTVKRIHKDHRRMLARERLQDYYDSHPRPIEMLIDLYSKGEGVPRCRSEQDMWDRLPEDTRKHAQFERAVKHQVDILQYRRNLKKRLSEGNITTEEKWATLPGGATQGGWSRGLDPDYFSKVEAEAYRRLDNESPEESDL